MCFESVSQRLLIYPLMFDINLCNWAPVIYTHCTKPHVSLCGTLARHAVATDNMCGDTHTPILISIGREERERINLRHIAIDTLLSRDTFIHLYQVGL